MKTCKFRFFLSGPIFRWPALLILLMWLISCNRPSEANSGSQTKFQPDNKLAGRFILKDANIAGFEFFNKNTVIWRDESQPFSPDTLSVFWMDSATFFTKDIKRINENCPPRVSVYRVLRYVKDNLQLLEYNTNWGNNRQDTLELRRFIMN